MDDAEQHPFDKLSPEFICDAIESAGFEPDARLFALNSFENRVYQVGLHDSEPLIAKFYRPGRWTDEQIAEEHSFSAELESAEIDIIAPIELGNGQRLFRYQDFRIALFKRMGGPPPDVENRDNLAVLGRLLGRMHAVARTKPFEHRPRIDTASYADQPIQLLLQDWVPGELRDSYAALTKDVLDLLYRIEQQASSWPVLRSHGDFHLGNMIQRDGRIHMLDLDDTRSAHAIQDIWMLLSGDEESMNQQLDILIDNYEVFHPFDWRETHLIEYYRTLRMVHHSAWIASRWHDPAFPPAFPWFDSASYWSNQILGLREQLYALQQSCAALSGNT